MQWAVGFVLGAVVAPPDAVAPMAIARRLHMPQRLLIILEGEGLVNDATALILFAFAVGAVSSGGVPVVAALAGFAAIVAGELAWGMAVAWVLLRIRRWPSGRRMHSADRVFWLPSPADCSSVGTGRG
jgi:CPA1 family monovalent cation:H+ antiporter